MFRIIGRVVPTRPEARVVLGRPKARGEANARDCAPEVRHHVAAGGIRIGIPCVGGIQPLGATGALCILEVGPRIRLAVSRALAALRRQRIAGIVQHLASGLARLGNGLLGRPALRRVIQRPILARADQPEQAVVGQAPRNLVIPGRIAPACNRPARHLRRTACPAH